MSKPELEPRVCECGLDVPMYLLALDPKEFTHTCLCNRVYKLVDGAVQLQPELGNNPFRNITFV